MNFNKTIKIRNSNYVKEKNFNKNYFKKYDEHKTISKDHYVLRHAFNILKYIRNENNEINPKEYLQRIKEKNIN